MNILKIIRTLLGLEKSISKIVSPIGKIVKELEEHSAMQTAKADKAKARAAKLQDEQRARTAASKEADALAANYRGLNQAPAE